MIIGESSVKCQCTQQFGGEWDDLFGARVPPFFEQLICPFSEQLRETALLADMIKLAANATTSATSFKKYA